MVTTRMAWTPEVWLVFGSSPQIISIKLVEPSAPQVQLFSGGSGGQFIASKSSQDFTNQRRAQTVRKLAIMFFIATKMGQSKSNDQRGGSSFAGLPSASATLRPPPGPQSWRCSPLLAHLSGFERTPFAFARNAAVETWESHKLLAPQAFDH